MGSVRILIAEDHRLVAEGMRRLLEPEFEVLGPVTNGNDVLPRVRELRPALLLLDLSLPGRNGMDLIPELRRTFPRVRILVVTMHADRLLARAAYKEGAMGYVVKDSTVEELLLAVRTVLLGRRYVSPSLNEMPAKGPERADPRLMQLTSRQRDIVRRIARGQTTPQIAGALGLSVHTIHFHRTKIRQHIGIKTDEGLTRFAVMELLRRKETPAPPQPPAPAPAHRKSRG